MNRRTTSTVTGIGLILAASASAALARPFQEPTEASAADLPAATSILDKFQKATNLAVVAEKTSVMHRTGKLSMPAMGFEGSIEAWSRKPNTIVTHTRMGATGETSQGFDGNVGWQLGPMGAHIAEGVELLQMKLEASYGSIKDPEAYESIETVGRKNFEGKDCYDLKVVAKPLEGMDRAKTEKIRTVHEFYDAETGLMVGRVYTVSNPQMGEFEMTSLVSDYKKFGDGLFPTLMVQKTPMFEIQVNWSSIEFPAEVDEAVFALPKEVADMAEKEG